MAFSSGLPRLTRWLRRAVVASLLVPLLLAGAGREAHLQANESAVDALVYRLTQSSIALIGTDGRQIAVLHRANEPPQPISEASIVEQLSGRRLSDQQAADLWSKLAEEKSSGLLTLPLVRAFVAASATPGTRDHMWSELAALGESRQRGRRARGSLLDVFEHHREVLLPLMRGVAETESAGNAMADLIASSHLFGDSIEDRVRWVGAHHPAALARRIQRERDLGRPVSWEHAGFEQMLRWKDRHLRPGAPERPQSLAALDAAGETFVVLLNSLHALDEWYRRQLLSGLGPAEVLDIVVGGEAQLYLLGTSSYRKFLHPVIMRGIAGKGSLESFLQSSADGRLGDRAAGALGRRAMVFLRVASAFGLLEPVIATVRERSTIVAEAIASLGDLATFESNASVLLDLLTAESPSATVQAINRELLERLYERHASEADAARKRIYGSLLSVYQSATGDRRDHGIDRDFPLDHELMHTPFHALFSSDPGGELVHRMFMRLEESVDGSSNYTTFRSLMSERRAEVHTGQDFDVYRIRKGQRSIEIYLNRPTKAGIGRGIDELAKALDGKRVHTVIGRGHTGIITSLRQDSVRVLGHRAARVAAVIIGTCGGTSSLRELIDTFGYTQIVSSRATGRQIINNAIISRYIDALLELAPDERLVLNDLLETTLAPYRRPGNDEGIREDARFYHVNTVSVYAAMLFDRYVRGTPAVAPGSLVDTAHHPAAALTWRRLTARHSLGLAPQGARRTTPRGPARNVVGRSASAGRSEAWNSFVEH